MRSTPEPFDRLVALAKTTIDFALAAPARYHLMFGEAMRTSSYPEVHAAAAAVQNQFLLAIQEAQSLGALTVHLDAIQLAGMLYAATHGAVDLWLTGHNEQEKGLNDPLALLRALLTQLRPNPGESR